MKHEINVISELKKVAQADLDTAIKCQDWATAAIKNAMVVAYDTVLYILDSGSCKNVKEVENVGE